MKIALNVLFQDGLVQSSLAVARRSAKVAEIGVGCGEACGLCRKKYERLSLDSASERTLSVPGKWTAEEIILNYAVIKCRQRTRAIAWASELVLELSI